MKPSLSVRTLLQPLAFCLGILLAGLTATAQVPGLLNYQGRVLTDGVPFNGSGQFKFALVNGDGSVTYWSNDGSSTAGGQPATAASLAVVQGNYSVLLGDTTLAHMTTVPATVFANGDVRLRVWFNDGTHGFELLAPDQRIGAVGYALVANLPDGAVTGSKLADDAVGTSKIVDGSITAAKLADGSVTGTKLSPSLDANLAKLNSSPTFSGTITAAGFKGSLGASELTGTLDDGRLSPNIPRLDSAGSTFAGNIYARELHGNGAGLTNLNAAAMQGVVGDIHLSTNVAKLNSSASFMGNLAAPGFFGSGAGLTGLNASSLATGTVPDARLSANIPRLGGDASFSGRLEAGIFAGNGAGLANLNASRLAAGTLPDDRLSSNIPRLDGNPTFAGVITADEFRGKVAGSVQWRTVPGTSQQTVPGEGYVLTGHLPATLQLPASPEVGDIIRIGNATAPRWRLNQNPGQSVMVTNVGVFSDTIWDGRQVLVEGAQGLFDDVTEDETFSALALSETGSYVFATVDEYWFWEGAHYDASIFRSQDGGISWEMVKYVSVDGADVGLWEIVCSSNGRNIVAVGGTTSNSGIIVRSTNGGKDWETTTRPAKVLCVAGSATGIKLVTGDNSHLYTSTDRGATWTVRGPEHKWWSVASSSDGVKLAAIGLDGETGRIYVSQDSGVTWSARSEIGDWYLIAMSGDGGTIAATGSAMNMHISNDLGLTWRDTGRGRNLTSISLSTNGLVIGVADSSQIGISRDAGVSWRLSNITAMQLQAGAAVTTSLPSMCVSKNGGPAISVIGDWCYRTVPDGVPSSTVGATGYVTGGPRSSIELIYAGDGLFFPVTSSGTIESH